MQPVDHTRSGSEALLSEHPARHPPLQYERLKASGARYTRHVCGVRKSIAGRTRWGDRVTRRLLSDVMQHSHKYGYKISMLFKMCVFLMNFFFLFRVSRFPG